MTQARNKASQDRSSSFSDLTQDLDCIYNTYVQPPSNISNETLDSASHEPAYLSRRLNQRSSQSPAPIDIDEDDFVFSHHHSGNDYSNPPSADVSEPRTQNSSPDLKSYKENPDESAKNLIANSQQLSSSNANVNADATTNQSKDDSDNSTLRYDAVKSVPDPSDPSKLTTLRRGVEDFKFGKSLGEGSYSTVVLATDKHTNIKYAVKVLDKRHIIREKKVKYVNIEKHALNRLANRCGIISLFFTFQDKDKLYYVLDYASNGELLALIKTYGTLNEETTRHYSVQLLDAINYMHSNGVIHRDIKPENILLDSKMRLQITDFGTARLLEKKSNSADSDTEDYPLDVRAKSFVGTAEYVSPELLDNKYCGKPGDIWAFGCIVYQMIAGKPPFKGQNEYQTFQKITKLQYAFSAGFPMVIRDLIKHILVLQPSRRYTIPQIQAHYFYEGVNWNDFDSIWMSGHPEIGPYKMNAKSMMKVPQLTKTLSQPVVTKKKSSAQVKKQSDRPSLAQNLTSTSVLINNSSSTTSNSGLPASAAAFVLTKDNNDNDTTPKNVKQVPASNTTKEKKRPVADYIPGTNILRPQVNSRAIRTLTDSSRKSKESLASSSSKSKVLDVSPVSPLEQAWSNYLEHDDERILKIGPVIASKQTVESFEKKYKGQLVDAPLGKNRMAGSRFLTQTVNSNSSVNHKSKKSGEIDKSEKESDSLFEYPEVTEPKVSESPKSGKDSEGNSGNSKISLFKKFLHVDKGGGEDNSSSVLDKPKTCTMLITTHGRVLLFLRDDQNQNYKLVIQVRLDHPFVQFKEVVSTGAASKFSQRMIPTTGIFAIRLIETAIVFEVEKFDVGLWTETLLKAKNNEHERKLEEKENPKAQNQKMTSSTQSPKINTTQKSERASPPKTPVLQTISQVDQSPGNSPSSLPEVPVYHTSKPPPKQKPQSPNAGDTKSKESMFNKKTSKSVKRKPPPMVSHLDMSTGLGIGDGPATLHAAQLAVSNGGSKLISNTQRSSFTKDGENNWSGQKNKTKTSSNKAPITSLNSKFLSRSRQK